MIRSKTEAQVAIARTADVLGRLHTYWTPHKGQIRLGRTLFHEGLRRIFAQCGRKWGKTEFAAYVMARWGELNQDSAIYYVAPTIDQAREIMWERLKQFLSGAGIRYEKNESHLRIKLLDSGSFIKLEGADNFENRRGITPSLVIADELKDIKEGWWKAMEPNLAPMNAPIIFLGTPPDHECLYTQLADQFKTDPKAHWETAPTHENPNISTEWLEDTRRRHVERGEIDVWEREYMGHYVRGGSRSIFPMFSRQAIIKPDSDILKTIKSDGHKFDWFLVTDPGTVTRFGALLIALNRFSRVIYVAREVYEGRPGETTVGRLWPVIEQMSRDLRPGVDPASFDSWYRVYDEAASWFAAEMLERFGVAFVPTLKAKIDKEAGLSLIKDQMLSNKIVISDACPNLCNEIENYIKDDNGKIPKKNDHLIDCLRYFNQAACYSMADIEEPRPKDPADVAFTRHTPESDLKAEMGPNSDFPEYDY